MNVNRKLMNRSARRAIIIDPWIAIPHYENIVKVEKENLPKYLNLAQDITAYILHNVGSTIIVPIVFFSQFNGLVAKSFDHHLDKRSLGLT